MTAVRRALHNKMETSRQEKLLSRSKSTGFLDKLENEFDFKCFSVLFGGYGGSDNRHPSISSIEACFECHGTESSAEGIKMDSGIGKTLMDGETLHIMDQKIEKLSVLLQEQSCLLMSIKERINSSKTGLDRQFITNKMCSGEQGSTDNEKEITNETMKLGATSDNGVERGGEESAARSLLDAIEIKQNVSLDHIIKVALENFMNSDTLKDHVASTTAECIAGVVHSSLCRMVTDSYLPMVERSHRRLVRHVTKLLDDSFMALEEGTASLFKSISEASLGMRTSLEKHQKLLEATDPVKYMKLLRTTLKGVLEEELKRWRGRVLHELTSQVPSDNSCDSEPPDTDRAHYTDYSPTSPMQPANPETSIIDSLMKCAVINKHIQDGDIDGAFEEALSSADLSLVMAACRAADPAAGPLRPAVLLSLLQQLATDMVHDTQLKCRYLEETILSLEKCDAATREHLPLVVGEVRKHLSKFLASYPKHHASRRIALIVMAANNLLK